MIVLRGSSLCSTCSANSESYFNVDKGLVDINTCSSVLESCNESFDIIFQFFVGIEPILELLEKMAHGSKDSCRCHNNLHKLIAKIRGEVRIITQDHVHQDIMLFRRNKSQDVGARLCGKLLNLAHKPFIEFLANSCQEILPELRPLRRAIVGAYLKNIGTTRSERKNNKRSNFVSKSSKPRILFEISQLKLPETNFLQGDVQIVKKLDSSYSSYFGAIGTTGNENSIFIHKAPMNLTHLFP